MRTLRARLPTVSLARATTDVRLQNWADLRVISEHGLVPKSDTSRRPSRCTLEMTAARLKIPRSPEPEATREAHSSSKSSRSGVSS